MIDDGVNQRVVGGYWDRDMWLLVLFPLEQHEQRNVWRRAPQPLMQHAASSSARSVLECRVSLEESLNVCCHGGLVGKNLSHNIATFRVRAYRQTLDEALSL